MHGKTDVRIPNLSDRVVAATAEPCAAIVMCGLVLPPLALLAAALGAWRLGADPCWTSGFFITHGPFSRYQLWFAIAIAAQLSAYAIKRSALSRRASAVFAPPARHA